MVCYEINYSGLSADDLDALIHRIDQLTELGWCEDDKRGTARFYLKKGISYDFLGIPACCPVRPLRPC